MCSEWVACPIWILKCLQLKIGKKNEMSIPLLKEFAVNNSNRIQDTTSSILVLNTRVT